MTDSAQIAKSLSKAKLVYGAKLHWSICDQPQGGVMWSDLSDFDRKIRVEAMRCAVRAILKETP